MQMNNGFKTAHHLIATAYEIYGCYWRVMGNLLGIDRATSDEALVGLAKNWVESFLDVEVDDTVA